MTGGGAHSDVDSVGSNPYLGATTVDEHARTTEGGQHRLRAPKGKDTSGNGGKPRDAFLPDAVDRDLQQFQNQRNIPPKDPFVDLSLRSVWAAVKRTAEAAADATGEEGFRQMSSHDLRRRFDQRLLVNEQVNPRVGM